jgi:hypothetical protein
MVWIASLWASSSFWEAVEYTAEAIVIVGALFEGLCDFEFILKGHENEQRRKRTEKLAFSVLIIGLALGLTALMRTNQLFTETILALYGAARDANNRATAAFNRADKAQTQSGTAILEAARLNKQAEDERLARVTIEARVAWRRLTEQQKTEIGSALGRRFSNQSVSFWYSSGDTESSWFAAHLAEAVQAARTLRVFPPGAVMTMLVGGRVGPIRRSDTGVRIQSTGDERSRQLAAAIIHELIVRGFDAARQTDPPFDPNPAPQVWVYADPRPDGPQGEFKLAAQRDAAQKKK